MPFGVVAPMTFQRTALEEHRRADAGPVVDGIFADIKDCTCNHPSHCTNKTNGCKEQGEIGNSVIDLEAISLRLDGQAETN